MSGSHLPGAGAPCTTHTHTITQSQSVGNFKAGLHSFKDTNKELNTVVHTVVQIIMLSCLWLLCAVPYMLVRVGAVGAAQQGTIYQEKTSGRCDTGAWGYIASVSDCEAGAVAMGYSDKSVTHLDSWAHPPKGCGQRADQVMIFNTHPTGFSCSTSYKCLCIFTCPPGTYQNQAQQTSCKSCASGFFSLNGAPSCDYDGASCPAGTYASGTLTVCDLCGKGKYNTRTGSTSGSDCETCATGQYQNEEGQSECKVCPSSQEPTGDLKACVPIGQQALVETFEAKTSEKCQFILGSVSECEAGAVAMGLSDTLVGHSNFNYWAGNPKGCFFYSGSTLYFNYDDKGNSCTTDKKCICALACQPGSYQDQTQQTTCKNCPTGYYQGASGKSSCKTCPLNREPTSDLKACVPIGQQAFIYEVKTSGTCDNSFTVNFGSSGPNSKTVTSTATLHHEKSKIICPTVVNQNNWLTGGSFSDTFAITVIGNQITAQRTDHTGGWEILLSFQCTTSGFNYVGSMSDCNAAALEIPYIDYTNKKAALDSWSHTPKGCFFEQYSKHPFSNLYFNTHITGSLCTSQFKCVCTHTCFPGTFQDQTKQDTCKLCTSGLYQDENGKSSCKGGCNAGSYITTDKSACLSCEPGQYQNLDDQSECKTCPLNQESTGDLKACVSIGEQASHYVAKKSGRCEGGDLARIESASDCGAAAVSMGYSDTSANTASWGYRPKGCYFWSGSDLHFNTNAIATGNSCSQENECLCTLTCPPGKYQDQTQQTTCKNCPVGYFQEQSKRSKCHPCLAGFYSDETAATGAQQCQGCEKGKYGRKISGAAVFHFPVTIGDNPSSRSKTVTVDLTTEIQSWAAGPYTKISCPSVVNNTNWLNDDTLSSLSFQISVNDGLDVTAKTNSAWHIVLRFMCTTANHCQGLCPLGTYSDITGLNDVLACKNCQEERPMTRVNGSTKESDCFNPDGCPIGSKPSSVDGKQCTTCGYSLYSETVISNASTPCLACPHGRYIGPEKVSTEDHNSIDKCIPCIGGRWYKNETKTCEVCPGK